MKSYKIVFNRVKSCYEVVLNRVKSCGLLQWSRVVLNRVKSRGPIASILGHAGEKHNCLQESARNHMFPSRRGHTFRQACAACSLT